MAFQFFEVFGDLKVDSELNMLLKDAVVEKVSTNVAHDAMRIYLHCYTLIPKRRIWKLESQIKEQYFSKQKITIKIQETFELSRQYTPQSLYEMYRDSILEEIYRYNTIMYEILKRGEIRFPSETQLEIVLEETTIAHSMESKIHDIFDKIFCERCQMAIKIEFSYKEAEKSKYTENGDKEIKEAVRQIMLQAAGSLDGGQNSSSANEGMAANENHPAADTDKTNENMAFAADNKKAGREVHEGKRGVFKKHREFTLKRSNRPDVIFGRELDTEAEVTLIKDIQGEMGEVTIRGRIDKLDDRDIRNEKSIVIFNLYDYTDSITVKMFLPTAFKKELEENLQPGSFIKLRGVTSVDKFDGELGIQSVSGIMKSTDFSEKRVDKSPIKRVELHCHTKMSDMDGVSNAADIVKQAKKWGHRAIAITDHGDVQAFPEAYHTYQKIAKAEDDFKILYGVEAYLVDDQKKIVTNPFSVTIANGKFVVFDLETTGFSAEKNRIIEIGAVKIEDGEITERFSEFVNPQVPIPYNITKLTSIRDDMVMDAPTIEELLPKFLKFSEGAVMVAHNADFDMSFIKANAKRLSLECPKTYADTVELGRFLIPSLNNYKLNTLAKALGVSLEHHHRAVDDAECTAWIFLKQIEMLKDRGICDLSEVNEAGKLTDEAIRKMHSYHCIILAKNDLGRINLYRLISASHIQYFQRRPKIPRSLIQKYREGLILGSACSAGELYIAIQEGKPEDEIIRTANFYDYLEIQPIGNNLYMLADEKSNMNTEEDLRNVNRKIVELGKLLKKPICATCDVHFLNPEDEVYRRIIMAGNGFKDADQQAPLYLHTTEEMLEEFSYLGSSLAEEVVVTNPNKIADMCDNIAPVRPDKCPPVIENSDGILKKICYDRAHELYGPTLPEIVSNRLERELNSIISNGYAVMYIIAQKLVWKSNEDGYLVGSRGSVGSSFVATMAGITEVNPLSPHYLCHHCHYVDFDSEDVKAFSGRSGCDMPDKRCPECGAWLDKEGFDIPFETFLGFKGNKEPDIDLNFSGDYQSKAHRYTEIIFGYGQTFKAGTIGTLADKTAYGYIKKYYEEHGERKRRCEIDRIVQGCVGVHRTTGQHPGGIIVLPMGEEINSFVPIQHPANDMTTDIVTTHFDYHSIDSNLLKLDILGHDDPTMIRMLQDLTGMDPQEIPLDDKAVMSLFENTSALQLHNRKLWHCDMGTLGIPEFGTDFAMEMLKDTKPTEFSDLIRIAGLAHGTDVWLGNAQELIQQGKATISTAICCRDDIMIYLISKGLDSEESFKIMEHVRKGKGLVEEKWVTDMEEHGVPDWYIWSCRRIKYMFPKAHAAAYVMMAWRIAYCKVFYPLAYYAAFFSIRATAFDYEMMCRGEDVVLRHLDELDARKEELKADNKDLTSKEKDLIRDLRMVQEMYARGYDFMPMDIYQSDARYFKIVDGKLLPALNTIGGMGDKAAESLSIAASQGTFLSKDDLRERGKVSKTIVDLMENLGIIAGLPESNQLSLFDL